MIELFGLKEQGTGVKERDLRKQVLLKVLSCGLERSLSISAPQIPWAARGWSYELTLVYKFWLSNHIVTVTLSQCGFGSEMAWDQAIPGAHFQEFDGVLICSGCYNKIPQTRHLINNRNVFRTVVGDCKPRIRVPAWSGSGESPLLDCRLLAPPCVLT